MADLNDKNAAPTQVAEKLMNRCERLEARITRVRFCIARMDPKNKAGLKSFEDEIEFRKQELVYKTSKLKKLLVV